MTLVQTEPKKIYLWNNELKAVYLWENKVRPSWPDKDYLCFTANTAGSTIKLQKSWSPTSITLETSKDGLSWNTYTFWNTITLSNVWDKVYRRNTSETPTWFSTSAQNYYQFVMTWSIAWSWDTNFLLSKNSATAVAAYWFNKLFMRCSSLTSAPELPATTLNWYNNYYSMFDSCTALKTAPSELPANSLTSECYSGMFSGCTALKTAPKISATTLASYCCSYMFSDCSSLENLPKLGALSLQTSCYNAMFIRCSKIKLSSSKTWIYQTAYRIPTSWTGTSATNAVSYMFTWTWWTFTSNPSINTTYYTSNTVV